MGNSVSHRDTLCVIVKKKDVISIDFSNCRLS